MNLIYLFEDLKAYIDYLLNKRRLYGISIWLVTLLVQAKAGAKPAPARLLPPKRYIELTMTMTVAVANAVSVSISVYLTERLVNSLAFSDLELVESDRREP